MRWWRQMAGGLLAVSLAACGSSGSGSASRSSGRDPYGVTTVDWPATLPGMERVLSALPARLDGAQRSKVLYTQDWFLVGNIPILSNAGPDGRVVVSYDRPGIRSAVVAEPHTNALDALYGFYIWGGAPKHCADEQGSPALMRVLDASTKAEAKRRYAAIPGDATIWYQCTLQQNPDQEGRTPRDQWAYAFGFAVKGGLYFTAARTPEERSALVEALVDAGRHPAAAGQAVAAPMGTLVMARGEEFDIASFDLATKKTTVVVPAPPGDGRWVEQPTVSPDGTRLVYAEMQDSGPMRLHIRAVDGSGDHVIVEPSSTSDVPIEGDSEPAFSPDGEWIAFARGTTGDEGVFVVRADGSGLRKVTPGNFTDSAMSWSPDGKTIAAGESSDEFGVRLIDVASGAVTRRIANASDPAWSPDGARIAYVGDRNDENRVMLFSTSDGTSRAVAGFRRLPASAGPPSWSPDGRWIMNVNDDAGTWAAHPTGTDAVRLAGVDRQAPEGRVVWTSGLR